MQNYKVLCTILGRKCPHDLVVCIVLNVLPDKLASKKVFRGVVLVTFLFSIPDFLGFIIPSAYLVALNFFIPLANAILGWVLPAFLVFVGLNVPVFKTKASN
ncbi:branched-chain amino acid transport system II carrier protein [Polaribacter sp.]|nr:branched-chain amino acid transport system II carrier protein [Polaribacter sp.]MDA9093065.1 branched-chain amino acid transport system II carrier protein [Polaribacter sp.]MDB4010596.1 branched-chain amino acid transport system II carrier protein [Polaribacter sp.]MDB4181163.1 branched-chain amino acid transport system II carrier protein [Polaribacter sp.]